MTALALTIAATGTGQVAAAVWHFWMLFTAWFVLVQAACVAAFYVLCIRTGRQLINAEVGDDAIALVNADRYQGFDEELERMLERMKGDGGIG